jgi:hypothetical protein
MKQNKRVLKSWKTEIGMKYLAIVLLLALIIPFASAIEVGQQVPLLGTFKQYDCVNLIQTCSNCSYVNISSVIAPNSTSLLGESDMTKVGTVYNRTFCLTSLPGDYIVNGHGDVNGNEEIFAYYLIITPTGGPESNTVIFLILASYSIILLVLSFIFKNYIFSFLSGLLFMGTGVYSMVYGFANLTNQYTQILSWVILGLGFIITIVSALEFLNELSGGDYDRVEMEEEE